MLVAARSLSSTCFSISSQDKVSLLSHTRVVCGAIFWHSLLQRLEYCAKLPESFTLHHAAIDLQASTAQWSSPFHAFLVPVFGTLAILLVGIAVSELAAMLRRPTK